MTDWVINEKLNGYKLLVVRMCLTDQPVLLDRYLIDWSIDNRHG